MCCPETDRYSQRIGKLSAPELIRVGRLPPSNIEGVTLEPAFVFEAAARRPARPPGARSCLDVFSAGLIGRRCPRPVPLA